MTELEPESLVRLGLVEREDEVCFAFLATWRARRASQEEALVSMIEHYANERRRLIAMVTKKNLYEGVPRIVIECQHIFKTGTGRCDKCGYQLTDGDR